MISKNYTNSTSFSGQVTRLTQKNLLKRAGNRKVAQNLKTKFEELESNTLKETEIFFVKNIKGLFNFSIKNKSFEGFRRLTNFCEEKDLVDTFLKITPDSINKQEKDMKFEHIKKNNKRIFYL